jgi:hypothetical protein
MVLGSIFNASAPARVHAADGEAAKERRIHRRWTPRRVLSGRLPATMIALGSIVIA